jgi:ketosteroid isomerase-like protein
LIREFVATLAAVALLGGFTGIARADDRAEIDALYAKLENALRNKTPEDTLALETADFTAMENGKRITGKQFVQEMKAQDAIVKAVKDVSIKVKKAAITGKTAKVSTDFRYTVEVEDPEGHMGPMGATHEMSMQGRVSNDLVKTAAGWKFRTMRQGVGKMLVDGKTVPQIPAKPKNGKKM